MRFTSVLVAPLVLAGCTLDYAGLATSDAGGAGPATSSPSSSTTTAATTIASSTSVGPGGGQGGAQAGPGSGGGGGTGGSGGQGGSLPIECEDLAVCEDDNPCTDDACIEGLCQNNPVVDGPLGVDDETDCIDRACEGGALVEVLDDDEDPPDTAPPCDVTDCVEGEPTQVLAEPDTSCGESPLTCNGLGVCIGCDGAPADECGAVLQCSTPFCDLDGFVCDPGFTTTAPTDPLDGDCSALDCSGSSAEAVVVDDDTDLPAPTACSERGCSRGQITTPVREEGLPCLAGQVGVCDGVGTNPQACKVCRETASGGTVDAGCSDDLPICDQAAAGADGECRVCSDDLQGSAQDAGCGIGLVCDPTDLGTCVTCYLDGNGDSIGCSGSQVCDVTVAGGTCVTCKDEGDGLEDPGCASPTPACDTRSMLACVECRADLDCSAFKRPNGDRCYRSGGTACGCTADADCSDSRQGTFCRTAWGNRCGCASDSDCNHDGSAGPNCSSNVCGP